MSNNSQDMAVVYANKAHLLEQLGRRQEALVSYRQALQLDPDDVLTTTLFREAQRREQLTLDKDKQERIDRLVAELLQPIFPPNPKCQKSVKELNLLNKPF